MFREGFFIKYFVYNGGKYRHEICYSCNGSVVLEKKGCTRILFLCRYYERGGMMELTLNSTVCLHTIQFRKEQKNYIVKDTITGEKYEMPPLWIDALAMMRDGFY